MKNEKNEELTGYLSVVLHIEDKKREIEHQLKETKESLDTAKDALISVMLEHGIDGFSGLGKNVRQAEKIFPRVNKADKDKQFEWLRKNGLKYLIQEKVNDRSFGKAVTEFIDNIRENEEFEDYTPEEILKFEHADFIKMFRKRTLSITAKRKKI